MEITKEQVEVKNKVGRPKQRYLLTCLECEKKFGVINSRIKTAKFCSNKCKFGYFRKHKMGAFFNPKIKKITTENERRNKIGFYFDPKLRSKGIETNKKNKTGIFNPKTRSMGGKAGWRKGVATNRKNKTGFCFDKKLQSKGGKNSGLITAKILRKKRNIIFNNIYFASYKECEFAMNIHYQFEKLVESKNYQVKVGNKFYDFFIQQFKCFIEYHPVLNFFYPNETDKSYYKNRKQNLNQNGYKNDNLIVIK